MCDSQVLEKNPQEHNVWAIHATSCMTCGALKGTHTVRYFDVIIERTRPALERKT